MDLWTDKASEVIAAGEGYCDGNCLFQTVLLFTKLCFCLQWRSAALPRLGGRGLVGWEGRVQLSI